MNSIVSNFLRGLGVVLPLTLTVWLIVWLGRGAETLLHEVFVFFLPERHYLPGLGVALGLVFVYMAGLLVQVFVFRQVWEGLERLVERVPLVKTIYGSIRDFLGFFSAGSSQQGSKVVRVRFDSDTQILGLLTDEAPPTSAAPGPGHVAVYLPMSYQVGGFTVLVPRERVEVVDMPVEDAMRYIVTAGVKSGGRD